MDYSVPIEWSTVNWGYVTLLSVFAFLAGLIGHLLSFKSRLFGAILTGVLFAAAFIVWTYYPLDPRIHAAVPVSPVCEATTPPATTPPAATPSAQPKQ
jgi:hypothetical protein